MSQTLRRIFATMFFLGSPLIATGESHAQPLSAATAVSTSIAAPTVTWSVVKAFEKNMKDMDVATTAPLTPVAALASFSLSYAPAWGTALEQKDHMVRRLGVLAKDRYASFSMSDQNGDDEYSASAGWVVLNAGKVGSVSAFGGGQFEIPLPADKPANHKLVLRGFEFRRKDGTDANIRSVGVWLDPNRNTARVMLMDDQGPDFRGFEQYIGFMFAAGAVAPMLGQAVGTAGGAQDMFKRLNAGEKAGKYRPYAVTVQYAWIPESIVAGFDVVTGVSHVPSSGKKVTGNVVLQGFEFFFTNSDHHLGAIGVHGPLADPGIRSGGVLTLVAFRDKNEDDPKRWALSYLTLKPSGTK